MLVRAASPDLSHIVLAAEVPLVTGAAARAIYMWEAGQLEALSVRPSDEGGNVMAAEPGSGRGSVRNAISADGSRVFWAPGWL